MTVVACSCACCELLPFSIATSSRATELWLTLLLTTS